MKSRIRVRRERPTALAWAMALATTMLMVYIATLPAARQRVVEDIPASARITRELTFEAVEGWCVALGGGSDAAQARLLAAGAAAEGCAACVAEVEGALRAVSGPCESRREAQRLADALEGAGFEAEPMALAADALRLRVTAPEAQIEAIADAEAALRAQIRQTGEIARQLGQGEIGTDAARTLFALSAGEAAACVRRLDAFSGSRENTLCAALISQLEALSGRSNALADSASGSAALAGMARCAQLQGFVALWEMRRGMSST